MLKKVKISAIILICAIILGTILQFAVFALPVDKMEENVKKSAAIFKTEGAYRALIPGIYTTTQDNYTDAAMLMQAIYNGGQSLVDRTMNVYCNMADDKNYMESLIAYCETGQADRIHSYYWYWHGYMIFLKPLLLFFDYGNIRIINSFFQMAVVATLILCLQKKGYTSYILPFGAAFLVLSPMTINLSLQFSTCYYIMMISSIIILKFYTILENKNLFYLVFFATGMATSFFDFFTYPVLTVGMPLLVYFILNNKASIRYITRKFVENCLFWGIGYLSFWMGKWLVASILLQKNCFAQGFAKITLHTSNQMGVDLKETFPISEVFKRNFLWMDQKSYIIIFMTIFVYLLVITIRNKISKESMIKSIPILVIGLFPMLWYIIACTHAYFHYWMEYRHCILFVFALPAAIIKCRLQEPSEIAGSSS